MNLDTPSPAQKLLVDARLGLITEIVRHESLPGIPPAWVGYWTHVARTDVYAPWHADEYSFGAAIGDLDRARGAAIGEAVERYCANVVPEDLIVASYDDLQRGGRDAIDPHDLALYSREQHAIPGFPFVPFSRDIEVAWAQGTDLHSDEPTLAPAALVYCDYYRGPRAHEPATNSLIYAGLAAGSTRERAERSALEEVFERDATTIWWASDASAAIVDDADNVVDLLDDPEAEQRAIHVVHVPSAFGVPVIAVLIDDVARGLVAFGSACRARPHDAAQKALVEAFGLLEVAMKLADPQSEMWRAMAVSGTGPYTAHRADRSYRDAFRADFRDMWDLPQVAQLYLDPRMQGAPLDRLRGSARRVRFSDIPTVPDGAARAAYLDRLRDAGLRAVSVDLTTPDVASAGLHVVRVLVPGAYSNAPAAFPLLGGRRLYEVPNADGWLDRELTEAELVRVPIPLA